ncbi:MAG: pyridoxine 5'-phosphate synthase [Bacteroidales bacterium]|nr:pyridoxine 5'-phosphate synthase [Bacteroidales bacterium]MDD4669706.1 pyridoxine 5'-phosphate synthase [Bacteroidales bacterium]
MTKLSVNINKIATLRNARGGNLPDVLKVALDCEKFGAQGITVHPRPDGRHIKYDDVTSLKPILTTEFNIEGNPIDSFINLVLEVHPAQVTLVPDAHNVLTSNAGWDTKKNLDYLKGICSIFNSEGIRTSVFVDPDVEMIKYAVETGTKRVELYTESYAANYHINREQAVEPYLKAAEQALKCGLGLNAGHDLNLDNLRYFHEVIPGLLEVSIGHALICDSIYMGLEKTIKAYLEAVK